MIIGFLTGRNKNLAELEIKSVLAREFAPSLAFSIVSQSPVLIHTNNWPSRWGKVPNEWAATTPAKSLSNLILALGGTIRIVDVLAEGNVPKKFTVNAANLKGLASYLLRQLNLPEGRSLVGISSLGGIHHNELKRLMGMLKHEVRQKTGSLRVVLPDQQRFAEKELIQDDLSAASVRKNGLIYKGYELVFVPTGQSNEYYIGLTLAIHNPDRDAWLDRGIPKSDALSGMLPPKLARMLVNVGLGSNREAVVLDPFCGNGRVLLEGLLLKHPVTGRDIDPVKVSSTKENINWLAKEGPSQGWWPYFMGESNLAKYEVYVHDVKEKWRQEWLGPHVVVTEPWLGPPLHQRPTEYQARHHANEVVAVLSAAVPHLLAERPLRAVLVVPRWQLNPTGELIITGQIKKLFELAGYSAQLVDTFSRPDSFVARDIILAEKPNSQSV